METTSIWKHPPHLHEVSQHLWHPSLGGKEANENLPLNCNLKKDITVASPPCLKGSGAYVLMTGHLSFVKTVALINFEAVGFEVRAGGPGGLPGTLAVPGRHLTHPSGWYNVPGDLRFTQVMGICGQLRL